MTAPGSERLHSLLEHGDRQAWSLAALALVLRGEGPDGLLAAAEAVLAAHGLDPAADLADIDRPAIAGQAAAPLLQTARLMSGAVAGWQDQSDEALTGQGRASAQAAEAFERFILPQMTGLAGAFAAPSARMLDVGTGVAALAVAFAERFPALTVVGIDVLPRALELAAATVAASPARDRVVLREQDVATIADTAAYDLAWLPAPFCPEPAVRDGIPAIARSLKPGGWMMMAYGKSEDDALAGALTRFKTYVYGGTPLDDARAQKLLADGGLVDVRAVPTPPGAPAITIGRRAAD